MAQSGFTRIRSMREQLSGSDEKVATFILANPEEIRSFNYSGPGNAVWPLNGNHLSFVKRVGFSSFREFSLSLAVVTQSDDTFFGEIDEEDDTSEIVKKVFSGATNALESTVNMIKTADWTTATKWLVEARRLAYLVSVVHPSWL